MKVLWGSANHDRAACGAVVSPQGVARDLGISNASSASLALGQLYRLGALVRSGNDGVTELPDRVMIAGRVVVLAEASAWIRVFGGRELRIRYLDNSAASEGLYWELEPGCDDAPTKVT
jgi:hypothetical protein